MKKHSINNIKRAFVIIFFSSVLYSCDSSAPNCSSKETKSAVTNIVKKELNKKSEQLKGYFDAYLKGSGISYKPELFEKIDFSVENVRTTKINKELGSFECKGELSSKLNENLISVPISFTSEQTDGGEGYYIQVFDLTDEEQGSLLSVLAIKEDTTVKESIISVMKDIQFSYEVFDIPLINTKLKNVLKKDYGVFKDYLSSQSSMIEKTDGYYFGQGCMKHLCTINEGAFVIKNDGKVFAGLIIDGKELKTYGAPSVNNLPNKLQDWWSYLNQRKNN